MPQIDPNYVSPHVRWALLLEDHPDADQEFDLVDPATAGVPQQFLRQSSPQPLCKATITWTENGVTRSFSGTREVDTKMGTKVGANLDPRTPEGWFELCTKALGRACKRAGYPGNTEELRQIVLWRRRAAEADAIRAGHDPARPQPVSDADPTPTVQEPAAAPPPAAEATVEGEQGTGGPTEPPEAPGTAEGISAGEFASRVDALPIDLRAEWDAWVDGRGGWDRDHVPSKAQLAKLVHLEGACA